MSVQLHNCWDYWTVLKIVSYHVYMCSCVAMLLSTCQGFYFQYGSIVLTGLWASIGVTCSSSSCPFLCAVGLRSAYVHVAMASFCHSTPCTLFLALALWRYHTHEATAAKSPPDHDLPPSSPQTTKDTKSKNHVDQPLWHNLLCSFLLWVLNM